MKYIIIFVVAIVAINLSNTTPAASKSFIFLTNYLNKLFELHFKQRNVDRMKYLIDAEINVIRFA